jgi:hypothetical protein
MMPYDVRLGTLPLCSVREYGKLKCDLFIGNKAVVCALSASYISTFAGYPVCLIYTGPVYDEGDTNMMHHLVCEWLFLVARVA